LQGVSCVSSSFCVAVGGTSGTPGTGVVVTWNGRAWTVHRLGDTLLNDVSCVSTTWCRAAGFETTGLGGRLPILSWNGTKWSTTIDHAPQNAWIHSLDCPTKHTCVAIGYQPDGTLVQAWIGGSWRDVPVPHEMATSLSAVACESSAHCVAVGSTTSVPYHTLIEVWDGRTWAAEKSANDHALSTDLLTSISCRTLARCVAVGWAEDQYDTHQVPLVESWRHGTWVMSANTRSGNGRLWGVSCPSVGSCFGVGDRGLPNYRTFAESGTP
jgi:hypothetical protein